MKDLSNTPVDPLSDEEIISRAASIHGRKAYQAKVKKHGMKNLRKILSNQGQGKKKKI